MFTITPEHFKNIEINPGNGGEVGIAVHTGNPTKSYVEIYYSGIYNQWECLFYSEQDKANERCVFIERQMPAEFLKWLFGERGVQEQIECDQIVYDSVHTRFIVECMCGIRNADLHGICTHCKGWIE